MDRKHSFLPAILVLGLVLPAAAEVMIFAEYHLGETDSLGTNNLPLDNSGNGYDFTSQISGSTASVGTDGVSAPGSSAYIDTSGAGNEGWYAADLFSGLQDDNFAFGVYARAASLGTTQGDVFTVGGKNGSLKISLANNGWAASAHNVAWIGGTQGASGSFAAGTWVHLAMIRSGGTTTFYIDGVAQSGTWDGTPVNDAPHLSVNPGGSAFFDGQIDEARVVTFDAGETTADIINALQNGSGPPADTDADGLPDNWELSFPDVTDLADLDGTLPAGSGPGSGTGDFDGDGLSDLDELSNNTNPTLADTDDDGLNDDVEIGTTFTNPLDADTDDDGLEDGEEDLNADGIVDPGESDPLDPDSDGDLFGDKAEVDGGSDPLDPASIPAGAIGPFSNGDFELGTTNGFAPADSNWGVAATGDLLPSWTFGPLIKVALNAGNGTLGFGNGATNIVSSTADVQLAFNDNDGSQPDAADVSIRQTFTTVPGTQYQVGFEMGAISFLAPILEVTASIYDGADISATGTLLAQRVESRASADGNGYNAPVAFTFTAVSTEATLVFTETSATTTSADPVIDNVTVGPAPSYIAILSAEFNGAAFEVTATGLDPAKNYVLTRSEDLADGFPTTVDGPRPPASGTDTFSDPAPAGADGYYRIEERP